MFLKTCFKIPASLILDFGLFGQLGDISPRF